MKRPFAIAVLLLAGCGGGDRESRVEVTGTVVAPKALAGTNGVGMVYVGVWSALDAVSGRPGDDSTLHGGTSIGSFTAQDQRAICKTVVGRAVRDAGANWEIDFTIPQVRYERGSVVWAFADENFSSCNPNGGPQDNFQYLVDLLSATDNLDGSWTVGIEPGDYSTWIRGGVVKPDVELVDEAGSFFTVAALSDTADTLRLVPMQGAGAPAVNGAQKARLYQRENPIPYGAGFDDVFDDPSTYLEAGDLIASPPEAGAKTLLSLDPVVITLDTAVP